MQDAYFQEKSDVGDWLEIGYSAPGTGSSYSYASTVFSYDEGAGLNSWAAKPLTKLNDCAAGTTDAWKLQAELPTGQTAGTATAFKITDASAGGANCLNLTASWSNLTRN